MSDGPEKSDTGRCRCAPPARSVFGQPRRVTGKQKVVPAGDGRCLQLTSRCAKSMSGRAGRQAHLPGHHIRRDGMADDAASAVIAVIGRPVMNMLPESCRRYQEHPGIAPGLLRANWRSRGFYRVGSARQPGRAASSIEKVVDTATPIVSILVLAAAEMRTGIVEYHRPSGPRATLPVQLAVCRRTHRAGRVEPARGTINCAGPSGGG